MAKDNTLYLIDGSGYIFRAYFALPQNLTNPKGEPIGAVLGFCNMLYKLLTDLQAHHIAVIFDAARRNFRNEIYAEYKAHRPDAPEDLIPQFPYFRKAAEAFGVPAIEMEGYEADDLIATYAKLARAQGMKVVVVGSDKDLYQIINDDVSLFDPIKQKNIGAAEVVEKFGVGPDKVIEVQALSGDATDNIPGVPGIGPKTAAELIGQFGDVETLIARAAEIKQPKRRDLIVSNAQQALISKQLVKLAEDAPTPLALEAMKPRDLHHPDLIAFLKEQGFNTLLKRLDHVVPFSATPEIALESASRPHDNAPAAGIDTRSYTLINDAQILQQWIAEAQQNGIVCIDTETTDITPAKADLVGVSLALAPGRAGYIPVGHRTGAQDLFGDGAAQNDPQQLQKDFVLQQLKPLLEDPSVLKIAHNVKYDWQMFKKAGITMAPCDDTMLMSYVLDGGAHSHGMDFLAQKYLQHKTISYEDVTGKGKAQIGFAQVTVDKALAYAAEDTDVTLRLHKILKARLLQDKMCSVYENIDRPLMDVIGAMELEGILVDTGFLKSLSNEFAQKLVVLEAEIQTLAGGSFNVASPKQIGEILFDQMQLPGGKKTKTGQWATDVGVLEKLAEDGHEIAAKILEHRQLAKLRSTYTEALQQAINMHTGRVHTSFALAHTSTGRLSSSDPNLQNIPIRTEEGRKIRRAFIAAPGYVLLSADYSQIELRLAAALAGIKALQQAFDADADIHALTASQVFDTPLDQVTPELRRAAKAVNFGIIYGISGFGLARQLGCSQGEANQFIQKYLARFRELQDFMEACKEEARQNGYVRTLYGRKCFTSGIKDKNPAVRNFAERQAINAPLQGTAADIMKIAMVQIPPTLAAANLRARMLLQVHDELVFEVPQDEAEKTAALVQKIMQDVQPPPGSSIALNLKVETGCAANWQEAH
ncbi:MAG: DNA polymerase I [Alphaproteobacteria bacterium]|nr:DNA polymerase I [Alphaproteobacteria bacterium]